VTIMRGQRTLDFPANATVVAACNRCPCARAPDRCTCTAGELARYLRRLSGPLLDRIDLVCQVEQAAPLELVGASDTRRRSQAVRTRVEAARQRQQRRLKGTGALCNGDMDGRLTRTEVPLDGALTARMLQARQQLSLSGRGYDRVLRVARTIADLNGCETLEESDLDEALSYRLDGLALLAA
jgi:magnesium chelatase family protein